MGRALADAGWAPDRVISSTATRARETARLAAPEAQTSHHEELYMGGLHEIGEIAAELGDDLGVVWAVGHNPALSAAASALCGESVRLATGNAACLEVEADTWAQALAMTGAFTLLELFTPH